MKLSNDDIIQIEKYMTEESFQSVDYFIANHRRLKQFAVNIYDEIIDLDNKGDLE